MADQHDDGRIDRRAAIRLTAAAGLAASLDVRGVLAQAARVRALTDAEFSLLDELAETIIPTDAHSPGARAAGVAAFIEDRLAEAWTDDERAEWRTGLAAIDEATRTAVGRGFVEATPAEREAVLTALAEREGTPATAAERFFAMAKARVAFAYYTSRIGLIQEMQYAGNVYLDEFVGYDVRAERR